MNICKFIDHTLLKQDLEKGQLERHCKEAIEYGFYSVMVHPLQVKCAKELLKGTGVKIGTVISFPFGEDITEVKVLQTKFAIKDGADEIDMVMCISKAKQNDWEYVINDIKSVKAACGGIILKVIIETCLLTKEEVIKACEACIAANADFVKTSTGFFQSGAKEEDIILMKNICLDKIKIKASGGIKNLNNALKMINAGAERIGTSGGINIADEFKAQKRED